MGRSTSIPVWLLVHAYAVKRLLVLAGLLANFVARLVRGATGIDILGTVAQAAIMVYAIFAALTQLQIAVQLTAPTFLIVLGAVALAAAIVFGWGARNVAQDIVERAYNRSGEARQRIRQQDGPSAGTTGASGEDRPSARPIRREE